MRRGRLKRNSAVCGNLVVGKVPVEEIERRYKAMGFDRAFGPGTDPQVTIACLKEDLGIA